MVFPFLAGPKSFPLFPESPAPTTTRRVDLTHLYAACQSSRDHPTMFPRDLLSPHGAKHEVERLGFRAISTVYSAKALRGGPRLLLSLAGSVWLVFAATWLFLLGTQYLALDPTHIRTLKPHAIETNDGDAGGGGLRIVVFGGGDVATPAVSSNEAHGQNTSWTEVLCQQLGCTSHLSFVPQIGTPSGSGGGGGPLVSNHLFEIALDRLAGAPRKKKTEPTSAYRTASNPAGPEDPDDDADDDDYHTWVSEQYPVPTHADLASQIDAFLALPRDPRHGASSPPPRETLWVFSFGYWDVWSLAALPRGLAAGVLESEVSALFAHVEVLYREAQKERSIAYSDFFSLSSSSSSSSSSSPSRALHNHDDRNVTSDALDDYDNDDMLDADGHLPRPPFRVLIPGLFDISLTPGFAHAYSRSPASLRPRRPPSPHGAAGHLRNAAFLTGYWNALVARTAAEWLALPDPAAWDEGDLLDAWEVEQGVTGSLIDDSSSSKEGGKKKKNKKRDHEIDDEYASVRGRGETGGVGGERGRGKRGRGLRKEPIPLPRREIVRYDMSSHIRGLIMDRQLRDGDLVVDEEDRSGTGGFREVWEPCLSRGVMVGAEEESSKGGDDKDHERSAAAGRGGDGGGGDGGGGARCEKPSEHLFWTEFTVNQRAVDQIGRRAAKQFRRQVEREGKGLKKRKEEDGQQPPLAVKRDEEAGRRGVEFRG
ncbi:hypothetical protein F4778DRAFT_465957 [Xylariomycetidae sp. FL2044]|nr:hypothetical protein F4778DRAFT_465957 [Xylariomycetidae sp. FL2044]